MSGDVEKKHWLHAYTDIFLRLAGIFSLGCGLWFVWKEVPTMAATGIAGGLILLFASNLQQFELLKAFGIEAKMKDLDKKIDVAAITLSQFKELSEATAKAIVMLQTRVGRWDSAPTVDESYAAIQQVKKVLELSGFAPHEIRSALLPWAKTMILDLAKYALSDFQEACKTKVAILNAEMQAITQPIMPADMPRHNALLYRRRAIEEHCSRYLKMLHDLDVSEFVSRMKLAISDCPELEGSQKEQLSSDLTPYIEEIEYLREHFEFRNVKFWKKT